MRDRPTLGLISFFAGMGNRGVPFVKAPVLHFHREYLFTGITGPQYLFRMRL
jgi:hypothetical protein